MSFTLIRRNLYQIDGITFQGHLHILSYPYLL
jgi:hypothetical protein